VGAGFGLYASLIVDSFLELIIVIFQSGQALKASVWIIVDFPRGTLLSCNLSALQLRVAVPLFFNSVQVVQLLRTFKVLS
jgi:hypothetical protein